MNHVDLLKQIIRDKLGLNIVAIDDNHTHKFICTVTEPTTTTTICTKLITNLNANTTSNRWGTYNNKRLSGPRSTNNQWSLQTMQTTDKLIYYQLQGYKILIENKNNKKEKCWICDAQYGVDQQPHIQCIIIDTVNIPTQPNTNSPNTAKPNNHNPLLTRQHHVYNPSFGNETHSKEFSEFKRNSIVKELRDVNENNEYWEGWMFYQFIQQIYDFVWIYSHQEKTVYIDRRSHSMKSNSKPLQCRQYSPDQQIQNKYITHTQTIRYDCQRSKQRGKPKERKTTDLPPCSMKTDCKCYINVKIFAILEKSNGKTKPIANIAVVSGNHPHIHDHIRVYQYVQVHLSPCNQYTLSCVTSITNCHLC